MTQQPTLLSLTPVGPHGSRSAMTCHYRCGNACDNPEPNESGNQSSATVADPHRTAVAAQGGRQGGRCRGRWTRLRGRLGCGGAGRRGPDGPVSNLNFSPVAPNKRDNVTVPKGFGHHVVYRLG